MFLDVPFLRTVSQMGSGLLSQLFFRWGRAFLEIQGIDFFCGDGVLGVVGGRWMGLGDGIWGVGIYRCFQ